MSLRSAVRRYAAVLFEVVQAKGDLAKAEGDLQAFVSLVEGHRELQTVLAHPAISALKKRELVETILNAIPDLSNEVRRLLLMLAERDRLGSVGDVAAAFTDELVPVSVDDYAFESIGIALPLGLIELSPSRWLIQDLASGRVAALISRTERVVRFHDYTVSRAADQATPSVERYVLKLPLMRKRSLPAAENSAATGSWVVVQVTPSGEERA